MTSSVVICGSPGKASTDQVTVLIAYQPALLPWRDVGGRGVVLFQRFANDPLQRMSRQQSRIPGLFRQIIRQWAS
jgi:hypothetical protein